MKKITAIVIGGGNRAKCYCEYAKLSPEKLEIVGVAEPNENNRNYFRDTFGIKDENVFCDWKEILKMPKMADVAFICTQDQMHYEPAMKALDLGYNLLLEKPVAVSAKECTDIAKKANEKNLTVAVCHVLRYTAFYKKVNEILKSGMLGDPCNIIMRENVGILHMSHSYVRGNWHRKEFSNPMLIAKCCHDLDIIYWLTGMHCKSVSSFGSLKYFKEENAPKGSPKRCTDGCKHSSDCMFYSPRVYTENRWLAEILFSRFDNDYITEQMKTSPYGKCVFHNDNDVVDHQVVNLDYENGLNVTLVMCGLTNEIDREIYIMGSKGELRGDLDKGKISVTDHMSGLNTEYTFPAVTGPAGHGGGDYAMMKAFVDCLSNGEKPSTTINDSIESHLMGYAAEEARINKTVVDFSKYLK